VTLTDTQGHPMFSGGARDFHLGTIAQGVWGTKVSRWDPGVRGAALVGGMQTNLTKSS